MKNILSFFIIIIFCSHLSCETKIEIARGNESYPPYEIQTENKLTGFHIEIINEVFKNLELEHNFVSFPWARAIFMVKNNNSDAITYISKSKERENYVIFLPDNILSYCEMILIENRENPTQYNGNLKSLKGKTIGKIRGYFVSNEFAQNSSFRKYKVNNLEQIVLMLKAKRLDAAVVNKSDFNYSFKDRRKEISEIKILSPPVNKIANYIGFSKKNQKLAEKFAKYFKHFKKTKKYSKIYRKYFGNNIIH